MAGFAQYRCVCGGVLEWRLQSGEDRPDDLGSIPERHCAGCGRVVYPRALAERLQAIRDDLPQDPAGVRVRAPEPSP